MIGHERSFASGAATGTAVTAQKGAVKPSRNNKSMGTGGGAKSGQLQWPMALARLVAKVQLKQSKVPPAL